MSTPIDSKNLAIIKNTAELTNHQIKVDLLSSLFIDPEDENVKKQLDAEGIKVIITDEEDTSAGLKADEEISLILKAQDDYKNGNSNSEALLTLINKFQPLIKSQVAHKCDENNYDDLTSIATIAFIESVYKFNPAKGAHRLGTYAKIAINHEIIDFYHENTMIKIPVYTQRIIQKLLKYAADMGLGKTWSKDEMKQASIDLSMSEDKINEYLRIAVCTNVDSIEAQLEASLDKDDSASAPILAAKSVTQEREPRTVHQQYVYDKVMNCIKEGLVKLPEKEKNVIMMAYGFNNNNKNATIEGIAQALGISVYDVRITLSDTKLWFKQELEDQGNDEEEIFDIF